MLQIIDVAPIASNLRRTLATFKKLEFPEIDMNGVNAVLVFPPWQCDHEKTPGGVHNYEMIGSWTSQHQVVTNSFYAARTPVSLINYHCNYEERLKVLEKKAIYVLAPEFYQAYQKKLRSLACVQHNTHEGKLFLVCRVRKS
ncbi:MAG: hypothetical protein NZM26_02800 [Patescibacteria group bacterium]|nr:hypothetical protein [Patescibacteria group bacterium]